ncbi:MAG: 4Fe-4S dicluster domain-containing protein [Bacteroidales bacterium]|jgi:ferredoxin|nr:4Fe-4S dicluster domain-containing protein [Bacteroidales bacterium]
MTKIDPHFAGELKKYGAEDFAACFNCGNCTAVCTLSEKTANFPRMMIRMGVLGLKKDILASKEPWLCYACGDCSETCPRQAGPGHYMAAIRRFAIAHYEPTGLARLLFKSNPFAIFFTILLAVILGIFLFTLKPDHEVVRWIFNWLPFAVIHDMGMVIFGFTGLAVLIGLINMLRHISGNSKKAKGKKQSAWNAFKGVVGEIATMKRYRDCDLEEDSYWKEKPAYIRPWFIHWSIMWGFIGLFLSTVLDFILKDPATNIWWPSRILGTVAGILMIYGASLAIFYRLKKVTKTYEETRFSDWTFLIFLWIAGITGFWMENAVAFSSNVNLHHVIFLIHTIISMELVILFAFSKFAHAVYRPLALFFHFKNQG